MEFEWSLNRVFHKIDDSGKVGNVKLTKNEYNARCTTRAVLGSQVQSPLKITLLVEYILLFPS